MFKIFRLTVFIMMAISFGLQGSFASEEKKGNEEAVIYLPVPTLVVTLYTRGQPKGFLKVSTQLLINDTGERLFAEKIMRRLKSAYLRDLMRLSNEYFDVRYPVDVSMISATLQTATNRVLKNNHARIFIANVLVQKD